MSDLDALDALTDLTAERDHWRAMYEAAMAAAKAGIKTRETK